MVCVIWVWGWWVGVGQWWFVLWGWWVGVGQSGFVRDGLGWVGWALLARLEAMWTHFGGYVGPSWAQLGAMLANGWVETMWAPFGAMLDQLGAMLAHLGAMLAHLGAMSGDHLGAMLAPLEAYVGPA